MTQVTTQDLMLEMPPGFSYKYYYLFNNIGCKRLYSNETRWYKYFIRNGLIAFP